MGRRLRFAATGALAAFAAGPFSPVDGATPADVAGISALSSVGTLPSLDLRPELEYFILLARFDPVRLTQLGIHTADGTFGAFGREGLAEASEAWSRFETRLLAPDRLADDPLERALLIFEARRRRFEIDSLRVWSRDPGKALRTVASGLNALLARPFASREERLRSALARTRESPDFLEASALLVEDPPRVYVEQAITQAEALAGFILVDLQSEAAGLADNRLAADLAEAATLALEAVWAYRLHLARRVLPEARASFAMGPSLFLAYLRATEGIDAPVAHLVAMAEEEVRRLRQTLAEEARAVSPERGTEAVLRDIRQDHPRPLEILTALERGVEDAFLFVASDGDFPEVDRVRILVRPTPRFSRMSHAHLSMPGPFETADLPGVLFVTTPEPTASLAEQEERLRFLNHAFLRSLAAHEAYPGHALQMSILRQLPSSVRRAVWSTAFLEGWAHYAEMEAMRHGLHAGDPGFRLETVHSALRRAGRFRAAVGLHAEGWSVERTARYFESECYLEPTLAMREAERGVQDPSYFAYTLGRLRLEALRTDLEEMEGEDFDAGRFHRRLLELGAPPLPLARAAFLGGDPSWDRLLDE